jgi:predicted flap endonuclease-1-like 5' DNA nuclease
MPVPIFIEPAVRVAAEPAPQPAAAISKLPLPAASSGPGNDLTRVRGIDSAIQAKLNGFGVRRFEELAALTAADVKALNDALGLNGRMDQENWVGQAHILATGGETYYSRRRDRTAAAPAAPISTPAAPVAAAPLAMPAAPAPVELQASAPAAASPSADLAPLRSVRSEALVGTEAARMSRPARDNDDLKRIRGIGVLIEKKLNSLGIVHYEQVANWTGADIERISNILDFKGRIEREAWIEQARILATGGQTEFSRRSEA